MKSRRLFPVLAALCLLPLPAAAQMPGPPTGAPAGAAGACTIVGPLLSPTDFGVAGGQVLADASSVLLPDGRLRMYIFA